MEKHKLTNRAVQQRTILSPPAQSPESPNPLERFQANKKTRATRQQQPTKQARALQSKKTRVGSFAKPCVPLKPIHRTDKEESPIFDPPQSNSTPPKPTKRKRSESAAERNDRMLKCAKKKRTTDFEVYNPILRAKMQAREASERAPLQIPVEVTHIHGAVMNHQDDQDLRSQAPSPADPEDKLWHVKVEEQEDAFKLEASIIDLQVMDMDDDDTYSVVSETPPPVPELARLIHDFECHRRSYHHVKPFTKDLTTVFDFYPDHSSLALRCHRYETFLRRLSIQVEAVVKCPTNDTDRHQDLIDAAAQSLRYQISDELEYVGYKERCPHHSLFAGKEEDEEEAPKRFIKVEV
ncbi:BZ3500_MvSof-1268-A1-R1_Chr3-1g05457 [Microbotryum saponariae]|uniref:BZ3500_MvSof-1268-A1-R1_Chr3-1g05457 protein n=1 Tax=Microbotryum saponariae TaxID=289078 RepID=A0A2X0KWC3_9BASI|nr:BZ3500_MvSof-1268-A1-R1_Chr3-1g05457 [Microbotryum saponariae]SDA04648.1 BZ3501_MvSof-1269-A2-R1_Chr3-1g05128 [Microbotryum saponariae]